MSKLQLKLIFYLLLLNSFSISYLNYPLYKDIIKSDKSQINSIQIKSKEQYFNYILNSEFLIALIYFSPYEQQFSKMINLFDEASSYKIMNKWAFIKVKCEESNDLSQTFENIDKSLPLIKIYIKSIEIKTINLLIYFELNQLLELLMKYSSKPLIEISDNNNIKDFYNKYGTFSPLVIYNNEHTEFISCISMLAKKKYFKYYYFGKIPIQMAKEKTEKIIFDNDNLPISMTWEGDCDDIDNFLNNNIYPLINKVDISLIYQLNIIPRTLVIIISNFAKNSKINNFILNYYKKISYNKRELVFGYIDLNEDTTFLKQYNLYINLKNDNDINLMIYNFYENIYYIHPLVYNFDLQNEREIYNNIINICTDLASLSFTSGSIFKDIFKKLGLDKIKNDKNQIIILSITFIIILGGFYILSKNNKPYK